MLMVLPMTDASRLPGGTLEAAAKLGRLGILRSPASPLPFLLFLPLMLPHRLLCLALLPPSPFSWWFYPFRSVPFILLLSRHTLTRLQIKTQKSGAGRNYPAPYVPELVRLWLEYMDELGQMFVLDVPSTGSIWSVLDTNIITSLGQKGRMIPAPHVSPVAPDEACFQLVVPAKRPNASGFKLKVVELSSAAFTASALQSQCKLQNMLRSDDPRHILPIAIFGKSASD